VCHFINIHIKGLDKNLGEEIIEQATIKGGLVIHYSSGFKKTPPHLYLSDGGGCACGLLGRNCDWKNNRWYLKQEMRGRMILTLDRLHRTVSGGFDLVIDPFKPIIPPEKEKTISLKEIKKLVSSNTLFLSNVYHVKPPRKAYQRHHRKKLGKMRDKTRMKRGRK